MEKEITLQDVINLIETTNRNLVDSIEATNKSVELLSGIMNREFGKVHQEIDRLDNKIDDTKAELSDKIIKLDNKIESVRTELNGKIESVKTGLEDKIENEIENLALMTKRGFDEMTGNFREVHEELEQIKNNVTGLDRRVSKLENQLEN